jgi:hypothetical protein
MADLKVNVNEVCEVIIPLPNAAISATLPYTIYLESDHSTFASGNLTYILGIQWKFSFTPLTVGETYIVQVLDSDSSIIYSKSFEGATGVQSATETTTITLSKTNIINQALSSIGADTVTSITDGTENANTMLALYPFCIKSLLSECQWGFATKRALLVTSSTTATWYHTGESIVYDKPTDIIRIFGTNDDRAEWREEGSYVLSDSSGLGIKYVYYDDDPTTYPASFVQAFIDFLAYQATFKISNSASNREALFEKYEKVSLPKARSENAQVGTQQHIIDDAWELAKYSDSNPNA